MKNSKVLKTILFIAGLILVGIGSATLFAPETFLGASGIDLGGQVNLFSQIRVAGGALLGSGILIIAGIFVAGLTFTSTVVATLIFLSYGIARILSMAVDGMPASDMVAATGLEIIVGLAGVFALLNYRENEAYTVR